MVAEMRATMGDDDSEPTFEQAAQAVSVVFHGGKRNLVNVNTAQAASGGSAVATAASPAKQKESWWTKGVLIWTVIGVLVAVVGVYIAYRVWHG